MQVLLLSGALPGEVPQLLQEALLVIDGFVFANLEDYDLENYYEDLIEILLVKKLRQNFFCGLGNVFALALVRKL